MQDRRACVHRQQHGGHARCAALCDGGGASGRTAFDQCHRYFAARLLCRTSSQHQKCVQDAVSIGAAVAASHRRDHASRAEPARAASLRRFLSAVQPQPDPLSGTGHSAEPLIALVAGEASGDNLGAALIAAIRERLPGARFVGVPGPRMREAGCEALAASEELALMGLAEILRHLPRLLRLRRRLIKELSARRPAVFVGIDAPEFNLGLARRLKQAGVPTVQYVSPQVWAWRQGRVRGIAESCDRILCLLPFEPDFFTRHGVASRFVGHPLADQFPLHADRSAARAALGYTESDEIVALLPGSRMGEVSRLATPFVGAAQWLAARRRGVKFIVPLTSIATRTHFESVLAPASAALAIKVQDGQSRLALAAADVVLTASGT
ncbi:MAG: lipid-A-disaccharide synthase, partial [Gammaproteobacteria bacterium]|nr:lipid-A-disaccharide synthase [Gammaproteobacteria bacterium]